MPWYVLHQANVFRLGIFREKLPQHCKVTEIFRNHNYFLRFFQTRKTRSNYSAKEPVCGNGSPLSDESKDGIKRGLSVFPCRVGNGMESMEGIGAGIGTEAT